MGREAPPRRRRGPRVPRRLLGLLLGMGAVGAVAYFGFDARSGAPGDATDRPISVAVQRGTLRITVTERGNLESRVTVDGICELSGYQNKIIQLVPEGNKVEKGDVVVRFDSAEIEKNIAQQDIKAKQALSKIETSKQEVEIAQNKGESEVTEATVEFELAVLDLEKYQKGDYCLRGRRPEGGHRAVDQGPGGGQEPARVVRGAGEEGLQVPRSAPPRRAGVRTAEDVALARPAEADGQEEV